jgi:hypothetical protein
MTLFVIGKESIPVERFLPELMLDRGWKLRAGKPQRAAKEHAKATRTPIKGALVGKT